MVPPVISYSVPAIVLNCITSVLTQRLRAWQKTERFELNVPHFLQLFIFAIIATPLNYRWQIWLERKFPGRKLVPKPKTRNEDDEESQQRWQPSTRYGWRDDEMAVRNWPCILYRWFTDCVIGSTFNAVLFLVCVGIMKNKSPEQIANDIVTKTGVAVFTSYKVWPVINLFSHVYCPVEWRVSFLSACGLVWNVYLSLPTAWN